MAKWRKFFFPNLKETENERVNISDLLAQEKMHTF